LRHLSSTLFPYTTLFRSVVADTGAAPQVWETVFVTRVVGLQCREQYRVEVLPVRQLVLVELLQRPALNLPCHEVVGREYHVVPGDRKSTRLNSSHVKISY